MTAGPPPCANQRTMICSVTALAGLQPSVRGSKKESEVQGPAMMRSCRPLVSGPKSGVPRQRRLRKGRYGRDSCKHLPKLARASGVLRGRGAAEEQLVQVGPAPVGRSGSVRRGTPDRSDGTPGPRASAPALSKSGRPPPRPQARKSPWPRRGRRRQRHRSRCAGGLPEDAREARSASGRTDGSRMARAGSRRAAVGPPRPGSARPAPPGSGRGGSDLVAAVGVRPGPAYRQGRGHVVAAARPWRALSSHTRSRRPCPTERSRQRARQSVGRYASRRSSPCPRRAGSGARVHAVGEVAPGGRLEPGRRACWASTPAPQHGRSLAAARGPRVRGDAGEVIGR